MSDINNQVFCIHCGKPIDEGDVFCKYCGKEQDMMKEGYGSKSKKEKPKRKWVKVLMIVLFSILGIGVLIGLGFGIYYIYYLYDDYKYEQEWEIEKQKREIIRKDIELRFETGSDSIQTQYAWYIIKKNYDWQREGFEKFDNCYFDGTRDKAFELIKRKATLGDAKCQRFLGLIFLHGLSWKETKDVDKGIYWIKEAAKQDDYWACYVLGEAYTNGWGLLTENKSKAQYYFQKSAEMGCSEAQYALGCLYINGLRENIFTRTERMELGKKKYTGPYKYTIIEESLFSNIYDVYIPIKGEVSREEIAQAQYWWKKAAAQGHEGAIEALQKVYE